MDPDFLNLPVSSLMRHIEPLQVETTLQKAALEFKSKGGGPLPVASGDQLVGLLMEEDLLHAFQSGLKPHASIQQVVWRKPSTIKANISCQSALDQLLTQAEPILVVLDEQDHVLGTLTSSDLMASSKQELRPKSVGGMATPFGVYLTNGAAYGGAPPNAIIATGASIFGLYIVSVLLSYLLIIYGLSFVISPATGMYLITPISLLLFFIAIHLSPLSGIHAAEHMTVYAIERGEELMPEIVSKMPRAHPRCGTNYAVGIALFLGISSANWFGNAEVNFIFAILIALFLWQPLGMFLQNIVTTKKPTLKQIESGITAGKELILKYQQNPALNPNFGKKLWYSGLPHALIGSIVVYFLFKMLFSLLHLPKLI